MKQITSPILYWSLSLYIWLRPNLCHFYVVCHSLENGTLLTYHGDATFVWFPIPYWLNVEDKKRSLKTFVHAIILSIIINNEDNL